MAFLGKPQSMIYTFSNTIPGTFARHKFPWPRGSGVYNALIKIMIQMGKALLFISEVSDPDGDS